MKRIHIFKAGKQTCSTGTTTEFSEDTLKATVNAYNPSLHEAPIVVGHPAENAPAYGWIGRLEYVDGQGIYAEPKDIEPQFAEMVAAGRFKKVSASFYTPDAPSNPAPGSYYLRHLGFLGAQPPAVKGLKPIEFSEEAGTIEFAGIGIASGDPLVASVFKRLREWFIDKFSRQEADEIVPSWVIETMEEAHRASQVPLPAIKFDEAGNPLIDLGDKPGDQPPKQEEENVKLEEQLAEAKAKIEALEKQKNDYQEQKAKMDKDNIRANISAIASEGRILPADIEALTNYCASLAADDVLDFAEGEKKPSTREWLLAWLRKQPKRVDFGEHSRETGDPAEPSSPAEVAQRITAYRERMQRDGVTITYDQALRDVKTGKDKEAKA